MAVTPEEFAARVFARIMPLAITVVHPLIPSKTLQAALDVVPASDFVEYLQIPHYWALYVHDGRNAFGTRNANYLVWFPNPKDDPRTSYGTAYPVREGDIRRFRLFPAEWQAALRENARRRAIGAPPFMIIAKYQPKIEIGVPFFRDGLAGFSSTMAGVARQLFEDWLREDHPVKDTDEARMQL